MPEWARSTFINNNGGGHHQHQHQNATANHNHNHHIMASPINSDAQELQFHRQNSNMFRYHSAKTGGFEYQLFPYFGKRIQKLRRHLDSSKPKSLLDLARIKDPVTFYTVVVALVLGVVSVVLAFLSLAASLVQTWASVKALHSTTAS